MPTKAHCLSLLIWLAGLSATAQKTLNFTPALDADTPPWARLMYAPDPDVAAVDSAYLAWYRQHDFVKTTHTQHYKKWRRSIEPYLMPNGRVTVPPLSERLAGEAAWQGLLRAEGGERMPEWRHLGPTETFSTSPGQVNVSWQANVYCIDQAPTMPQLLYCGTETGGVYKTTEKGLHWTHASANTLMRAVHSVKIDPTNAATVYAGDGTRVYKTVDGGANWAIVLQRANLGVNDIAVSPADPSIVLAAAEAGLFRSTDGGTNWAQLFTQSCWDLEVHPAQPGTVYVLKTNPVARRCEFFKSDDAGATFSIRESGWYSSNNASRRDDGARMTVTPADPDRVYVVLAGESKPGDNGFIGVYRSNDAGESWSLPNPPVGGPWTAAHPNLMTLNNTNTLYQGYYNLSIAASHTDPDRVLIGGLNLWKTDNGAQGFTPLGGYQGALDWIHPDQQEIKILGNDAWVASDGGVNYSADFFATHQSRKNGITASDFWGFGSGWNEDLLVGGRYHNGNSAGRNTFPAGQFLRLGGAEAPTGYVNPGIAGKAYFSDIDTRIVPQSIEDQVRIFPSLSQYPGESYFAAHSSELEFDPLCYRQLYIGKENKLWRSENEGASFELVRAFGNNVNNPVLHFELSRSQPGVMYVYQRTSFSGATLWKTTDNGLNWQALPFPAANSQRAGTMALSLEDHNTLWVAFGHQNNDGAKVFKTIDGGLTWQNLSSPILNGHTISYIFHQGGTDGAVYIGTNFGVFYRDSSLSDWELFHAGLPDATYCNIMRPFYKAERLRMATYSHGIWEADFKVPSAPLAQPMVDKRQGFCARDTFYFEDYSILNHEGANWLWTFPGAAFVSDYTARNPKVVFGSTGTFDVSLTITNAAGQSSSKSVPAMVVIPADACAADTVPGYALQLAGGSTDFASIPPLDISTNTLTFSAWVKRDGNQAPNAGLVFQRGEDGDGVGLNFGNNNELRYHWDGQWWWDSGLTVPDGEWAHIAMVVTPQQVRLYLNGRAAANNATHTVKDLASAFYFGADPNFGDRRFRGLMEEVCIWDRALTQDEIRLLRHLTKKPQDDASLIAYYQFNEPTGDALDRVGLRHATFNGAAQRFTSTAPVGGGTSSRRSVSAEGLYDFADTDVLLYFPANGVYPNGELVASRINLAPDQLVNEEAHSRSYWIVNNYGNNATFTLLDAAAFVHIGEVTEAEAAISNRFKLYTRPDNADGDTWELVAESNVVTPGPDGSASFGYGEEISQLGQFVITRDGPLVSTQPVARLPYPFVVYPNPAPSGSLLHVATEQVGTFLFTLFDASGRRVAEQQLQSRAQIPLPHLPAGMYVYRITGTDMMAYGKVVLE